MRNLFVLSLFFLYFCAFSAIAIDLDEEPEKDLAEVDNAAAATFSLEDIEKLELEVLDTPPVIDGDLTDKFWASSSILAIDLEMYPTRFAKSIVDTDALIGVTKTHVYFAFNAYDPDVSQLRTAVRDEDGVKDDDYVSVVIDPTGNLRKKYEFRVNPSGSKSDVLQNTVSDRYIYDWDTEWEAAAKITDSGYLVEIAIPIDSLRSPKAEGEERNMWALILKRSYPRKIDRTMGGIYIIYPPNPISGQQIGSTQGGEMQFENASRNLEIYPYAIYHSSEKRDYQEPFEQRDEIEEFDAGMDLTLTIDNSTIIAGTINPNFTDVEADIARDSINNPFNVFKPEKRRFFQEGMDLYSTLMSLVYTRNIIDPDLGLSVSHETKEFASGVFWASDEETEVIIPDNLGSDTVELDTLESQSMAGRYVSAAGGSAYGFLTTIRTADDYENGVVAHDGLLNLGIDDKLRYQVALSSTEYPVEFAENICEEDGCLDVDPEDNCELGDCATTSEVLRVNPEEKMEGYAVQLKYKHTGPDTLFWGNYFDISKDFRADLGFLRKSDYRLYNVAYGRNWYFETFRGDEGKSRARIYLVATHIESQSGQKIETGYDIWGEFRGSYQTVLRPGYRIKQKAVNRIQQNTLELNSNAPKFDESYFQWYLETSPITDWTFNLDGRYGDIADADNIVLGKMKEFKPRVRYQVGDFNFSLQHTFRNFDFENKELYQENFTTFTANYRRSDERVFRFLVKWDETDRDVDRWRGEENSYEREIEIEFTHTRYITKNLALLTGLKFEREKDNTIAHDFTNDRQFYLKLNYNMGFIGN
ncbi:sugar-binding protein [Thalassotalea nanhaiensis]|uniref:Sugar-binding protein n=1 Tax=Thalassotalea nanhaiensis TaxID=3065648 RepID=A0ABY9TLS8_9GAMM|nr:sugar-binding protein [Colwelliaceae bacterium SQ345]